MTGLPLTQDNLPLGERLVRRWLDEWSGAALLVALLALAASVTSLPSGFAYDDLPIIYESDRLHDWRRLWHVFGQPYWEDPGAPKDLYRPLILSWFGVQWVLGGGNPLVFHAVSVLLYLLLALAVLGLARLVLPGRFAAIGGMIWAVHPVHVEAVGNVVGQAELVTALALVLAVGLYLRARLAGALSGPIVAGIACLYPIALLTKEHGITLPVLLGGVELILWRRGVAWTSASRRVGWLLSRLLVYETLVYLVVRWLVLPSLRSVPHYTLVPLTDVQRVWAAIGLWPEVARLMLWPARLYADYSPQLVTVHRSAQAVHLVSVLLAAIWGWLAWSAWRARHVAALLGLVWFPITFALVANVLFPSGILLAERTLFLPSVALALGVGAGSEIAVARFRISPRLGGALIVILIVLGVRQSAVRQRAWTDSITVFSTTVVDAPQNARSLVMLGRLYYRAGADSIAARYLRRAYELEPAIGTAYVMVLFSLGRCDEALAVAPRVVQAGGLNDELEMSRIACLLQVGRYTEARGRATKGLGQEMYLRLVLLSDSLLAATDSVDVRNRWVRAGRPFDRSAQPFTIRLSHERSGIGPALLTGGKRGG